MTQVDFYHLTSSQLEAALLMLLKKTFAAGKTGLILCPRPVASAIDTSLWAHEADSWIAHGVDDSAGAEVASAWVSSDPASNPINAPFLFLLHGQTPLNWAGFERVFNLFDGRSEVQVSEARTQWKEWSALDALSLSYYAQTDDGRWQKNA